MGRVLVAMLAVALVFAILGIYLSVAADASRQAPGLPQEGVSLLRRAFEALSRGAPLDRDAQTTCQSGQAGDRLLDMKGQLDAGTSGGGEAGEMRAAQTVQETSSNHSTLRAMHALLTD